ncbi:hypothetical protein BDY24DRAFT_359249 [Mrakia frigida]|uniref:uncharacterized protein n=1 Tax=Mrakia frigida TaxID=29902 RepID=UPI003FCC1F5C
MSTERSPLLPTHVQPSQETVDETRKTAFSLASAVGALKAGKLPSHDQIDKLLSAALDSDILSLSISGRTGRLSEEGARVVKSLREVISAIRTVGEQKNGDDKIQETLWSLSQVEVPSPPSRLDVSTSSTIPSRKELDADSRALLSSLQKIFTLALTSSEFRKVINQAIQVSASILADASGKIAENASAIEKKARETEGEDKPLDIESTKKKGKKVAKGLTSGRIQGEAKEEVFNQFEGLSKYFEDKVSGDDEIKDQLFEKLKAVVVDVQSNKDYQSSIDTILKLVKKYGSKAEQIVEAAGEKVADEADQSDLQNALGNTKEIIESFASGESLDPVLDAAKSLKEDVEKDDRVSQFFNDLGNFLEASLKVEGYVTSQRAYRRSSELWERGQKLATENARYKKDIQDLSSSLSSFSEALADDPATSELAYKLEDFAAELTHAGKSGINALKAESSGLYRDVVDVVIPRLVALVKEIPLPRTEFTSADVDFAVDDLRIESASFIPDSIRIIQHNDLSLTQGYAAYAADYDGSLRVRVDGLRFNARDISYWVHKKNGLLNFEDEGLLAVSFDNKGISFDIELENASEADRESFFVVKSVNVDISDLEYAISRNKSWLLWLASGTVSGLIKKTLKHSLESQIASYLRDADLELYGLQNRAIAATNAKPTALNYVKAVFSPSLFSGSSSSKLTQKGVVTKGRRGEWVLAVGIDDQIFKGKAGPSDAHAKRSGAIKKVEEASDRAGSAANAAKYTGNGLKIDAEREASKLGLTVKKTAQEEARKDGWRSELFDI